jgi:hypothetical protein
MNKSRDSSESDDQQQNITGRWSKQEHDLFIEGKLL